MSRRSPSFDVVTPGQVVPAQAARRRIAGFALLLAGVCALAHPAQADDSSQNLSQLKEMSLEALLDVEVTSVSRRAQKLSETPSAIQVITSDDIHRSGATSRQDRPCRSLQSNDRYSPETFSLGRSV